MTPVGAGGRRSAAHRPEPARRQIFQQYPDAERSRRGWLQPRGLPVRGADQERVQHRHRPRRLSTRATRTSSAAFNFQDDSVETAPQYPRPGAAQHAQDARAAASPSAGTRCSRVEQGQHVPLRAHADPRRHRRAPDRRPQVDFRNIDSFDALTASSGRDIPTHTFVDDFSWVKGSHTLKFGTSMRFSRVGQLQQRELVPPARGERVVGVRSRTALHARRPVPRRRGRLRRAARRGRGRSVHLRRHVDPDARHHLGGGRVLQLRHARATCCRKARPCAGASARTSTSSTSRTAGRWVRTSR